MYVLSRQSTDVAGNQTPSNAGLVALWQRSKAREKQATKKRKTSLSIPPVQPTNPPPASQPESYEYGIPASCLRPEIPSPRPPHLTSCILHTAACVRACPSALPHLGMPLSIHPARHPAAECTHARTHARPATAVISVSAHVHTYYVHRDGKHIARNQHTLPTSLPQNAATPIPPAQPGEVAATQRLPCLCVVDNKLISPEREERDLQGGRAKPKTTDQGPKEPNRGVGMGWDGLCCLSSSLRSGGTREMRNWLARRLFAPRWREP